MNRIGAKGEIVTFKADAALLEALAGVSNRSEFIRTAVLAALQNICPLCRGRGTLTPNQRKHWVEFVCDHSLSTCDECHEVHVVCQRRRGGRPAGRAHAAARKGR